MPGRPAPATTLAALLLAGSAITAQADERLDRGRDLARRLCATCHVIGDYNRFGGIGSTPSFQLLAGMKDGRERFETFFARRPHPSFVTLPDHRPPTNLPLNAPPVKLSYEELADLVAYALTLRDPRLAD